MGVNFESKIKVVFPDLFFLGVTVMVGGILAVTAGFATLSLGEFILPPMGWCALGFPVTVIGTIMLFSSLRR